MKNLMETNIYDVTEKICICGTCAPNMEKEAYKLLTEKYDNILFTCLENIHVNMVISKVTSMLRTNKIKEIAFASVDGSYHCIQLHLLRTEIEKIFPNRFQIKNYILLDGKLYEIDSQTITNAKRFIKK